MQHTFHPTIEYWLKQIGDGSDKWSGSDRKDVAYWINVQIKKHGITPEGYIKTVSLS